MVQFLVKDVHRLLFQRLHSSPVVRRVRGLKRRNPIPASRGAWVISIKPRMKRERGDCKKLTALAADGISPKTTGIVTADRQVIRFMVSSLKIVAAGPCSVAPLRRLEATRLL